jgi:hypothetical protein
MVGAALAIALLGNLPVVGGLFGQPDKKTEHLRVGNWGLDVVQDRFTGSIGCEIRKSAITYRHGVVVFQFGHNVDTANAEFRVDNGPARPVSSVTVEAAGLGARFGSDNLDNPSDGVVNIPASVISNARQVSIRPNARSNHRTFDLTGLAQAVVAARSHRCDVVDEPPHA